MLKTKISSGKSADGGLSIYDHFSDPNMEDKFVRIMKRPVKERFYVFLVSFNCR